MSESIAEMVLPNTYIEVRAEGLIGIGPIATGNIGIVGTSAAGPVDQVVGLGDYGTALDMFGAYDAFDGPDDPLTMTRALEQAFAGGARNVFAVRSANGAPAEATLDVQATGAQPAFTLTADGGGTWARSMTVEVSSETVDAVTTHRLKLTYRAVEEVFEGPDVDAIHAALADSTLVTVGAAQNGGLGLETVEAALTGGSDGADATTVDLARSLAALENENVNIVLVAGGAAGVVGNILLTHVERTENEGRERIAVVGADTSGTPVAAAEALANARAISDDRVVLCAPGLVAADAAAGVNAALPPAYTAAMVAGKLATLATHVSLTNKAVPMTPAVHYSTPVTRSLMQTGVLVVRQKFGSQVVRGITTQAGPFRQISIRRTVDFAKALVRAGSDPYIGRLNNARVRAALKGTIDGGLSGMVENEQLIDYQLDVSATRAQEINGIAAVVMTLRPTFSIDYIRVTMNLA